MEGKQSEYDFLNLSKNYTLKNNITREEEIQFSDKVSKINSHGWKQERYIIITDKAIYNLKKLTLKRRIDFKTIMGITLSKISDEFVIHCDDIDYDYHYISPRKKIIVEILAKNYQIVRDEELKLFEFSLKSLSTFVTSKKEKEKQKNTTRMPNKNQISVNDYLFGDQSKTDVKKIQPKKGIKKKSTFQNVKVEYNDFEIIQIIGRGSVGKVALVKYNKDGKFYAMKSMRKDQLISEGLADNVLVERNILMEGQCEFILTLSFFFQTPERIYFVCPYIAGGDLFHKLKEEVFLKEELVRFYGFIKLCDFGASIKIRGTEKEYSFAGSPEYASPEMITYEGHTFMTDWWSFGVLLYELLYGNTPFYDIDKNRMFDLITSGSISFPKSIEIEGESKSRNYKVSEDAKSLITKLLEKDPGNRLGRKGLDEIKKHPFFSWINFEDLKKKKGKVYFKPTINSETPTNNFDEEYLNMELTESPVSDWCKENNFKNWFDQFENIWEEEAENDEFEVIDSSEVQKAPQGGDDDED